MVPFQNCSHPSVTHGAKSTGSANLSGNGDAYEGRLTRYNLVEQQPCPESGANGQPLPNRQIHLMGTPPNARAFMVRENCSDLPAPVALDSSLVTVGSNGQLTYESQVYTELTVVGDFDVVAASCPSGMSPRSGGTHVNLLQDSQNLSSQAYEIPTGIGSSLTGSLGGLPRYEIVRNDSANLDFWRRVSQVLAMKGGKRYAFTFFAKPGTSVWAGFGFYEAMSLTFTLAINLSTGAVRDDGTVGVQNVSVTSRPLSGGRIVTVYFDLPQDAAYGASGVFPSTASSAAYGNFGDSIYATAMQLEDVSNFCQ